MTATQWPQHLSVSVNISPAHLLKAGLVDSVAAALKMSGLDPNRLELEIRESNLLRNGEATLAALHRLRELGVRVALDDFGTGYSSLTYLQSFPFDKIKIDPSFVVNAAGNAGSLNIVRAVAMLAKGLGMVSTAEGVETHEQLAAVRAEGCSQMQGYLSSKPLPEHEVALLLLEEQVNGKLIVPTDDSHLAA
jgi:EAL domain-containing protein (putative c-di-GMP-specific phosphodiesterase class I)